MSWRGMDAAAVAALSSDMRRAAERVEELSTRLDARLADTAWCGQDAARFRESWESRMRTALQHATDALASASEIAQEHVERQTQVSA